MRGSVYSGFSTYPLAKKLNRSNQDRRVQHELATKETIQSCVEDFLQENGIEWEEDKVLEITDYIYRRRLFRDYEEAFWVDEDYLEQLKIVLQQE